MGWCCLFEWGSCGFDACPFSFLFLFFPFLFCAVLFFSFCSYGYWPLSFPILRRVRFTLWDNDLSLLQNSTYPPLPNGYALLHSSSTANSLTFHIGFWHFVCKMMMEDLNRLWLFVGVEISNSKLVPLFVQKKNTVWSSMIWLQVYGKCHFTTI